LVIETQRRFLSDLREETDTLGVSMGSTDTSLALSPGQTLGSIQPGAVVQIDYELMFVLTAPSPSAIGVLRGYLDTSAVAHTSSALVTVNPRFPVVDLIRCFNEELDDLTAPPNGLYQVSEITLSYNPVIVGYDLTDATTGQPVDPSTWIDIIEVRAHEYGPAQRWPHTALPKVQIMRNADTTQFPSGNALRFDGVGYPGRPIRVLYKATYSATLVNSTDDIEAVSGLHSQAHDILTLGAAYRLMQWRELKRSFTETQSEPRRAQEVPVGSSLTAVKGIMQHRTDRIAAERARLDMMYRRIWR
jgi:hypothetical protein